LNTSKVPDYIQGLRNSSFYSNCFPSRDKRKYKLPAPHQSLFNTDMIAYGWAEMLPEPHRILG
jgi:hypothetical protein